MRGADTTAVADRLITHLRLDGQTADLVRETFGTAASNALAATIAAVVGFLFWGMGIGQIVQNLYARAWRIEVSSAAADQWLFAIWFFVLSGLLALVGASADRLHAAGLILLVPIWIVGSTLFWLWTPRFLLRGRLGLRAVLPDALLSTGVIGEAFATAPLWIGPTLNAQGRAFGSFGIALAVLACAFIMITMSLVCAVFAPVWADWRQARESGVTPIPPRASSRLRFRELVGMSSRDRSDDPEQLVLPPPRRTLLRRLTAWAERARGLRRWIEAARRRWTIVDATFEAIERDSEIGGVILAGAPPIDCSYSLCRSRSSSSRASVYWRARWARSRT
jgi:uncharacterized membrane protein